MIGPPPSVAKAVKEFSKSRLKHQHDMREQHKRRSRGGSPSPGSSRNALSGHISAGSDTPNAVLSDSLTGNAKGKEKAEDPLQLIRREVAVMKKLEWVELALTSPGWSLETDFHVRGPVNQSSKRK